MFYVYILLNIDNNKRYIGKTNNIELRMSFHINTAFDTNADGYNRPFYRAIRKYAKVPENMNIAFIKELLEEYNTEQEALDREIYYIALYKTNICRYGDGYGYNLTDGGEGVSGFKWSEISKQNFSQKCKGRVISAATRLKLSTIAKGRKVSDETKKKLSEQKIGDKNPMFGKIVSEETRQKLSIALIGRKRLPKTIEQRLAMSIACLGKPGHPHKQETKDKLSLNRRGDKGSNAKLNWDLVRQIRLDYNPGIFGYVKLAKKYNMSISAIQDIIKNHSWKE